MKTLSIILQEKLHIDKNSKSRNKHKEAFEVFFEGLPKEQIKYIWDKYIVGHPFSKEAENALLCTPFELLFTMGIMLVDDNLSYNNYTYLGTKWYKTKLHGQNNPYDSSWFEEEINDDQDILDYLKNEWIPNNEDDFIFIYNLCEKYPNILTLDKIINLYDEVLCF